MQHVLSYIDFKKFQVGGIFEEIEDLKLELIKTEGIDKAINEYIATFKKELSRREQELFATRAERR